MNHEIQQISLKYKNKIHFIVKIQDILVKIQQKEKKLKKFIKTKKPSASVSSNASSKASNLSILSKKSKESREEKVKKAQFHMKFSGSNLEQAFYPVEEKV